MSAIKATGWSEIEANFRIFTNPLRGEALRGIRQQSWRV